MRGQMVAGRWVCARALKQSSLVLIPMRNRNSVMALARRNVALRYFPLPVAFVTIKIGAAAPATPKIAPDAILGIGY
jgi:hypothetical protein